jgi:hypothetical protein
MNLEDYFDMLHKMAQKNPQSQTTNRGQSNKHLDEDSSDDDEEPLPIEDKGET